MRCPTCKKKINTIHDWPLTKFDFCTACTSKDLEGWMRNGVNSVNQFNRIKTDKNPKIDGKGNIVLRKG